MNVESRCRICEEIFSADRRSLLAILKLCRVCYLIKAAMVRIHAEESKLLVR